MGKIYATMALVVVSLWNCAYLLNILLNILTYLVSLGRHPGGGPPIAGTGYNTK